MYVKTQKNGIINLNHYPRIDIFSSHPDRGPYLLCAYAKPILHGSEPYDRIAIATYDSEEKANAALDELYDVIVERKPIWAFNGNEKE